MKLDFVMRLVDAHCHLEDESLYSRLDSVLRDARAAGIVRILTCAVTPEQWPRSAEIARQYPEVAFALGVHPWFATEESLQQLDGLRRARELGASAIGEIGLDSKVESPSMELQTAVFEAQLAIAKELALPVIIHCRGAFNELHASLKRIGAPTPAGIMHAFSGNVQLARTFVQLGLKFSLGRSLTYKPSAKREELLRFIYPEHLLLETDSPDMPPIGAEPGIPNEPRNLPLNLRGAAELLGCDVAEVAEATTRNASDLFTLGL
jgi:TatD DNase family protein